MMPYNAGLRRLAIPLFYRSLTSGPPALTILRSLKASTPSSTSFSQFAPRRSFNPNCPLRPNVYHLYGVSLVHEPELKKYFGGNDVTIEWVDDASCNLVYSDEISAKSNLTKLLADSEMPSPNGEWKDCRPLRKVGVGLGGDKASVAATELQVRAATTGDVKDLHHRGDVDSTYYQLNCDRVVRRKLSYHGQEWHKKKQERQENFRRRKSEDLSAAPRIGLDGVGAAVMNPLLFLRASNSSGEGKEDLLSMVNSAEESLSFDKVEKTKSRKRQTSDGGHGQHEKRTINLPIAVVKFCKKYKVKYEAVKLRRTYRSISFGQQKSLRNGGPAEAPPWEVYISANGLESCTLGHAVWIALGDWRKEDGVGELMKRRVVVLVPHVAGTGVSLEMISRKFGMDAKTVSVSHMQKELGFPPMVCPPFGHQFAPNVVKSEVDPCTIQSPKILVSEDLLAASTVVFDLGNNAIKIAGGELSRLVDLGASTGLQKVSSDILLKKET